MTAVHFHNKWYIAPYLIWRKFKTYWVYKDNQIVKNNEADAIFTTLKEAKGFVQSFKK